MARPEDLGLEHTWRLRLRRQAASGLSIAACGSREGVSSASFYAWRRRLAAPPPAAHPDPPQVLPIRLEAAPRPDDAPPGRGFEIALPHRVRLRCDADPDPEWPGRLGAALAGLRPREVAP